MNKRTDKAKAACVIGFALALGGLVSACGSPQPKESPVPPKPLTAEERVRWYQTCWTDFNEKKWDDFKTCYAPIATSQQPGQGKPYLTGPAEILAAWQDFEKSFPDIRGEGQLILINGNHIAGISLLKGTNTGLIFLPENKQISGTNKKIGLLFGHVVEIDPLVTKVLKEIAVMDGVTLENQLGLLKMPGRPLMDTGAVIPAVVIAKNDDTEMKNIAATKSWMEMWSKHDPAVFNVLAGDAVIHDVTRPKDMNKTESINSDKTLWAAFSDLKLTASSMWAAGEYVVIAGASDGTNDGDLTAAKMKKTGKKVSALYIEIDRLQDEKIKEVWFFMDNANFISQLAVK